MWRSWGYPSNQKQQQQHGWETTSPNDYHDHLSKMIRTPSVLPDVPQYPNVHRAFNRPKAGSQEEDNIENTSIVKQPKPAKRDGHSKSTKHSPHFQEKVEVIEFKEEAPNAASSGGKKRDQKIEAPNESVDSRADGYIQQRHQKFELCKWATFRVH